MGPDMMQQLPRSGGALRHALHPATTRPSFVPGGKGEPHSVWVDDEEYKARTVILSMGAEHKKLGVPGEEELGGRGVSYCATCDAAFFKDRTTVIVGGGDSAMEEAIFLAKFSSKVDDRAPSRRVPRVEDHARAREGGREHRVPDAVHRQGAPAGEKGALDRADLINTETGEELVLPMAGAFIAIGHEPQLGDRPNGIVEVDDEGYAKVDGRSTRDEHPRRLRRRRPRRPHLPPGDHRLGLRLPGRARRRVVPARQPRCPDAGGPRGHREPRRGAVGSRVACFPARARRRRTHHGVWRR